MTQTSNQTPNPNQNQKKSNTALIIVLVVIGVLIFLAVGGYLAWKYVIAKKISSLASTVQTTATPSPSPSPSSSTTATPTPTPTTTTTTSGLKTGTMPVNGYVIADSNSRVISQAELVSLTPWQLKVARNEIYARYGRPFVHKDLQCYFAHQLWYRGNPNYSESMLSAIDNKNVATIQEYERLTNSPLQNFDSGC